MSIAAASRGDQAGLRGLDRFRHAIKGFQRSGLVKVQVSVVGIGGDRPVVPAEGGVVFLGLGMFLCDAVEAERVAGFGFQHLEEAVESVGFGHGGIVRRIEAEDKRPEVVLRARNRYAPVMIASIDPHVRHRRSAFATISIMIAACTAVLGQAGCDEGYSARQTIDLRPRIVEVQDHHGGTRRVTVINGEQWYQSFGPVIEIIDAEDGLRISTIELGPFGTIPSISDMVLAADGALYVAYANDRVVRFDLSNPRRPTEDRTWTRADLGVRPIHLSATGGTVWVSGREGVGRLDEPGIVQLGDLPDPPSFGHVVETSVGPVVTNRRQVIAVADGRYLGAASDLRPVPPALSARLGKEAMVFVLRGAAANTVGLMGPDFRQLDAETFGDTIWSARIVGDRLWAICEDELITWRIDDEGRMVEPQFIPVKGARDVGLLRPNYYAVAGTFGRAIYRYKADSGGAADEFLAVERTPGRVVQAITDGRRVLAGSEEGNWLYRIGGRIELSDKDLQSNTAGTRKVTLSWGEAEIGDGRTTLSITPLDGADFRWSPPNDGRIYTLETADERIWVGHDEGIEVFEYRDATIRPTGSILMEGPVAWLFRPRVGNEVAFVSAFGGMGTAEAVPDPEADSALVQRVRPEEAADAEEAMREAGGLPQPSKP